VVVQSASSAELLIDSLDLLSDIVSRFDSTMRGLPKLQEKILKASVPLLGHSRAAVRKRAVGTIGTSTLSLLSFRLVTRAESRTSERTATLIPTTSSSSTLFPSLLSETLLPSLKSTSTSSSDSLLTSISLISSVARTSPSQLGPHIPTLIPLILSALTSTQYESNQETLIEVREGCLTCLESLVLKCKEELRTSQGLVGEIVGKAVEALRFDPNYAGGDGEEDEEMENGENGEEDDDLDQDDFEDE